MVHRKRPQIQVVLVWPVHHEMNQHRAAQVHDGSLWLAQLRHFDDGLRHLMQEELGLGSGSLS